jgi:hypothetical protein
LACASASGLQRIGGTAQILTYRADPGAVHRDQPRHGGWYHPLTVAAPALTLFSLNIFGKMALGGLSGFECVAILAGECKNPGAIDRPGHDRARRQ